MWVSDIYIEPHSCCDIIPIVIGGVVAVVIVLLGSIANYVIWKRNNGKNSSCVIFLKWISCMTLYLLIIDLIKRKNTYLVRIKQMLCYFMYFITYVMWFCCSGNYAEKVNYFCYLIIYYMTSFDCPFLFKKCVPCFGRVYILVWYISLPTTFFVETITEEQVTLLWFGIVFPIFK